MTPMQQHQPAPQHHTLSRMTRQGTWLAIQASILGAAIVSRTMALLACSPKLVVTVSATLKLFCCISPEVA